MVFLKSLIPCLSADCLIFSQWLTLLTPLVLFWSDLTSFVDKSSRFVANEECLQTTSTYSFELVIINHYTSKSALYEVTKTSLRIEFKKEFKYYSITQVSSYEDRTGLGAMVNMDRVCIVFLADVPTRALKK